MTSGTQSAAQRAKDAVLAVAHFSGFGAIFHLLAGRRRAVLSFHNVLSAQEIEPFDAFRVDTSLDVFRDQLDFLLDSWSVRPAQDIADIEATGVFLTFDDGMLNGWTTVASILAERSLTAVFAVCPGLIDGRIPHTWRDHIHLIVRGAVGGHLRLPHDGYRARHRVDLAQVDPICRRLRSHVLDQRIEDVYGFVEDFCARNAIPYERSALMPDRFSPMTWDMLKALRSAGHVIASHSMTHRILRTLSSRERRWELQESRMRIRDELGSDPDVFVYPYGGPNEVDSGVIEETAAAGYSLAFANVPGGLKGPPRFALPRFGLPPTTQGYRLQAALSGLEHRLRGRI